MNFKVIAIAAVVLVLFIMMGNNPTEVKNTTVDRRDPLRKSIEETLADPSKIPADQFRNQFRNTYETQGSGNATYNPYAQPPATSSYGGAAPLPAYQQMPSPPANAYPAPNTTQQPNRGGSPFDNLPTFAPGDQSSRQGTTLRDMFTLDNGKQLAFSGDRIYTLSATGERVEMKDGYYKLKDGTLIIVRDGKRQVPLYPVELMVN